MAQTQQERHGEHAGEHTGFTFSQEDLNKALAARGFRVHDGFAYAEYDGALFRIVAPTSPLAAAHGYAEFIRNRVVANRNGVSPEAAAAGAADGSAVPNAKSNDAFDTVYRDRIAELVDAAKGWDDETIKKMTKEQRAERTKLIDASAFSGSNAPKNREKYYDETVKEALEAGKAAGAKRDTKRRASSTKESIEL
jgi:hypothetical protein